jgi:AcrR family transcriptional regulator
MIQVMVAATTRDRLVSATREAIRDLGLPAVTAREIARRASANLAAIPYHFGTKEALVTEALVAEARELLAPVWELLGSDRPPIERATAAVVMLNELFDQARDDVPVYLAALAAAPHSSEVRAGLGDLWNELRARLASDIAAQSAAGRLPAWVEPRAMAALVLAVVNGVVIASVIDPDGPDHRAVAGQLLALLVTAGQPASKGTTGPRRAIR